MKRADNQIDYSKRDLTPQLYALSKSPLLTLKDSAKMSIFKLGVTENQQSILVHTEMLNPHS